MFKEKSFSFDPLILFLIVCLLSFGLLALYSTSQSGGGTNYFASQLKWIIIGLGLMIFVAYLPHRLLFELAYPAYFLAIVLLAVVLVWGHQGYGATRWIRIGSIGFQPSEFAKLATLMAIARYLSDERVDVNRLKSFLTSVLIFVVPFLLIAKQPDLGTGLVFVVMVLPIIYWAGLRTDFLILIVAPAFTLLGSFNYFSFFAVMVLITLCLLYIRPAFWKGLLYFGLNIVVGLVTPLVWGQLKDYQRMRIHIFVNPEADPLGAGYQIIQSKVAIGSGGLLGKGFLQGSQTQLRFLPEQHTDFIFAVIGEEFGFLGVLCGLALFGLLLSRIVSLANSCKSRFAGIMSIGIATIIGFHMLVNIGMTIGLFPVTGLPLPFISYGGSALMTNLIMMGMLHNFYRHRYEY